MIGSRTEMIRAIVVIGLGICGGALTSDLMITTARAQDDSSTPSAKVESSEVRVAKALVVEPLIGPRRDRDQDQNG